MAVMVGVAARLFVTAATVIITHEASQWLSDKLRSRLANSRSKQTKGEEDNSQSEQIKVEEDRAFIEGEDAAALDPNATTNPGTGGVVGILRGWIRNPQVLVSIRRVPGHEAYQWLSDKFGPRLANPVILETTTTTVATTPVAELIKVKEDGAFIEGEDASALADPVILEPTTTTTAVVTPQAGEQIKVKEDRVFIEGEDATALADPVMLETTTTTAVATFPATEQIKVTEDRVFIEGEDVTALADPVIPETTTTTTTVATPSATEQIKVKEDGAFIKGEDAGALDPNATTNAGGIGGVVVVVREWISNPQVLARIKRVAGGIILVVVDSQVEPLLRRRRAFMGIYSLLKNEARRG